MAPRKNYTPEQMAKAIEAVRNGEKVAVAAQRFGVPRITLRDKITGKTKIDCTMGPSTVLTKTEEDILVRWLIALSERHIPMTKDNLLDSVQKIITVQNRSNPFTNNRPSKKWFQSFLKRHPELAQRVPENLTRARDGVTENNIRNWFQEIENYLEENNLKSILSDANRVFNTDESAFFLSPKPGRVLAKKGDKHLYSTCGDEKDNLTVLITGNAAGELAPPMIIYNYERIPSSIAASVPDEWAIGKSESGWMCSSTFYEYMTNVFNPWLEEKKIEKPILFFLDGHRSHLTLHLSNFCSENGIEVIALYPNSTHILQPMDLSVFRPLKLYWKKTVNEWKMENLGLNLRKENFAPVLQKALSKLTKDCVKNGFRAGGLFPFGPDYIDVSKIRHRDATESAKKTDPAQTEFVKYLESEIVKVFSAQKLQQFNKFYYENRKMLENELPDEDIALYTIWAKNKSEVALCPSDDINTTPSISKTREQEDASIQNQSDVLPNLPAEEEDIVTGEPSGSLPDRYLSLPTNAEEGESRHPDNTSTESASKDAQSSSKPAEFINNFLLASSTNGQKDTPIEDVSYSLPAEEKDIFNEQLPETLSSLNLSQEIEDILSQHLSNIVPPSPITRRHEDTSTENRSDVIPNASAKDVDNSPTAPLSDTNTFLSLSQKQHFPTATCLSKEVEDQLTLLASNSATTEVTPQKTSMDAILGVIVPSPFKKNLFWPGNNEKKKRITREKIPSTVTSKAWKVYHEKKEMDKKKKEEEKENRARQRLEKKKLKELLAEDKKSKSKLKPIGKKRLRKESTSEDTDLEIPYAESDASYLEDDEDDFHSGETKKIRLDKNLKYKSSYKQQQLPSFDSDVEDLPSSIISSTLTKSKKNKKFSKGQFVIVKYEGEYFPGKVESVDSNNYEISTMVLTTGNTFRWPGAPDKIMYSREEIVEEIKEPICLNKRGFYRIPEMDKYLPDIYGL